MGLGQLTTRVIALQNALIEPKNKKEREKKKKKKNISSIITNSEHHQPEGINSGKGPTV